MMTPHTNLLRRAVWTTLTALALSACQSTAQPPVPAKLIVTANHSACLAQIQNAAKRPDGIAVVLTNAAFANTDRLSIVPAELRDTSGNPAQGRQRGVPDSYLLRLDSQRCVMQREGDGQSTVLSACSCEALATK